jgi:hypothetical protein
MMRTLELAAVYRLADILLSPSQQALALHRLAQTNGR